MNKRNKIIIGAILAVLVIVPVAFFSLFTVTFVWPVQTNTGVYPGRICIFSHSSENYTGKGGIYVPGETYPSNCAYDNGTFVFAGVRAGSRTYSANGTLIEYIPIHDVGTWIPKNQSGLCVVNWSFGGPLY